MAYCTLAEVRALDTMSGSPAAYTDAMITEAIAYATARIDAETGTSWEYKTSTVTRDGNGFAAIDTGVLFVRAVTTSVEDGVSVSVVGWAGTDTGIIRRPTGTFPVSSTVGRNVVLTFTAGATSTAPDDIRFAARTLARWYCLQLLSRTPSNVLQTVTDMGTTTHVQPGGPFNNATALPEVNQVLRHRCHKVPGVG